MNYLKDYDFLKRFDQQKIKTQYIRINILNKMDNIVDSIEGKCTNGSLSFNGKSAVRRTGSLTMVATNENKNISDVDNLISINKRVLLQIGIKNTTNEYTDQHIIWFPLGVYIITNANINKNK